MNGSLHIQNARIWTGDPARPWARSLSIDNGRISALDAVCGLTPKTPSIDAQNRIITPGLIDAHLHLLTGGKTLTRLDLSHVQSRDEFEAAIAARHAELPPNQWLIANGWSQEAWDGELPDKTWLRAAGERPVVCYRMDMHIALINDAVLRLCNLSLDPPGGQIVRDATGNRTGLMIEAAAWQLVNPLVPEPDAHERQSQLLAAQRYLHSMGVTAAGSMEYQRDVVDVFQPTRVELTLRCRITLLDRDWPLDVSFGRDFRNDEHLAIIGYKAFIDGTLGSRTAKMLHEYADDVGNRGMLVELAAAGLLHDWACRVATAGLSPSMHAIGDEAARLALDAIDQIDSAARPRIEHAQQIDVHDIPRFAGRIASMQPLHKADDCRYVRKRLGDVRLAGTFAFRKLHNAGAILAFGSDWPVVSPDPLLGMRTAITGLLFNGDIFGAEENLTPEESLRAYTTGAAFALGMDDAGVVCIGNHGDLVMFDRDPFTTDWRSNLPRVLTTIVGGRVVYDNRLGGKLDTPT